MRSPDKIRKQQPINEELRVVFRANLFAGLQLQNVDPVPLAKYRVDAPLNADRRRVSLQFQLRVLEQMRVALDEFFQGLRVPHDVGAKCVFIKEVVGNRRERNQVSRKHGSIRRLQIGSPFQHSIEERMHQLPLERVNGDVALTAAKLIELRLRA